MIKKWILKAKDGKLTSTSSFQKANLQAWIKENDGKFLEVTPKDKITASKRGYFEGAIVTTYCWWNEALDPANAEHRYMVREMFKTEFNGVLIKGMWSEPRKVALSTSSLSNRQFGAFLERITRYFEENEIPIPNPELYKAWQDMFMQDNPDYFVWLEDTNQRPDGTPLKVDP